MTRRMLRRLGSLYMVDLLCDEDVQPVYERLGMRQGRGMMLRNCNRQSASLR